MGVKTAVFSSAGRTTTHKIPGAVSRFGSAKGRAGFVSTSNAVILGTAFGGVPGQINWVGDAGEAAALCQYQGNLLECAREFFKPGGGLRPQRLGMYRINTAVQAGAILVEGANPIIDVASKDYGILFNQIQYKLGAGTLAGVTKKFSETYKGQENIIDNISKPSITLSYIGAAATATVTISATQLTTATAGAVANLTVPFATYPTIDSIIAYINASFAGVAYVCTAVTGSPTVDLGSQLDVVTAVDIKTPAAPTLYSNIQAMIDAINDKSLFCSAVLHAAAARTTPLTNVAAYTAFTGGTEGAAATAQWTAALLDIEDEDVQFVGVASEDAAVHAVLDTHIDTCNAETGRAERQSIYGAAAVTIATATAEANTKTRYATNICYLKYKQYDINGVLQTFTSMEFAAKLLGLAAAQAINEPLTNKVLDVVELVDKPTKAQQEAAIDAGLILGAQKPDGTIRVVRQVTCSHIEDVKYVEFSCVREMLYMTRDLREGAEKLYVGVAGTASAIVDLRAYCVGKLQSYANDLQLLIADPDDPTGNPAWKDLKVVLSGDTVRVQYSANVVAPFNFIFITGYFDILVQAA